MIQVFHGAHRQSMTPCMVAFEKWWNESGKDLGIPTVTAWVIFRNGHWRGEESAIEKEVA